MDEEFMNFNVRSILKEIIELAKENKNDLALGIEVRATLELENLI